MSGRRQKRAPVERCRAMRRYLTVIAGGTGRGTHRGAGVVARVRKARRVAVRPCAWDQPAVSRLSDSRTDRDRTGDRPAGRGGRRRRGPDLQRDASDAIASTPAGPAPGRQDAIGWRGVGARLDRRSTREVGLALWPCSPLSGVDGWQARVPGYRSSEAVSSICGCRSPLCRIAET
jgi:hypothetical protein